MKISASVWKRAAAAAMAGAMVCSCALGAAAETNVKKDETVYVTLAADGSLKSATDSVWLHADSGLSGYTADSGLSNITMLKDTAAPEENGGSLRFTEGTDAYYQGTAAEDLPITTKITYTLDGTEMTAEEMAGKSGHLVMHISFTNNSYQMKTINGESRRICTPFVTVVAATLDTDTFGNVKAENGTVQTDSSKDLAAFVCLPGMKECFDGLLTDDLAELGDKLQDDVTLEADVTDFEMPMLYIAASTDASDFEKENELSDFDDLFDELDGLDEKLDTMMDGVEQLLDGSRKLNDGAGQLYDGLQTLDSGVSTLQNGAHQVSDGSASAASGAGTLSDGLNTLSGNSGTLRDSTGKIADAILSSANTQLKAAGVITEDMTWENYATVMAGVLGVTDEMRAAARETIRAQAGNLTDAQLNALIYLTAVSGGSDFTAAGAQMTQAQADAAPGGAIGAAQAALAAANNDPTAVPAVNGVMQAVAYQTLLSQITAAGAAADTAPLVLVYGAQNNSGDLQASLAAAGAALGKVSAAQAALTTAGGQPLSVPEVAAVMQALSGSTNPAAMGAAYSGVAANLTAAGATQAQAALIITMAAQNDSDDFQNGLAAESAVAQKAQAAQAALAAAGSADQVAEVKTILGGMVGTAYQTATGKTGVSDDSTNALLITMACQSCAAANSADLTGALVAAGSKLTNADAVQKAMARANDAADTEAQQLMTAFLTNLVKTEKSDDLAQVSAAAEQLQQVQAYVQGINTYTAGVDQAASGAATLASGLNTLKDGSAVLAAGTDSLKSGADRLLSGAATLKNGTGTLTDGVQELYDGVDEACDKIQNGTADFSVDDLKAIKDTLEAVKTQRENYTSFAGDAANEGSVKFVMKVAAEKTEDTTVEQADTAETETKDNVFQTIWKHFAALFHT